MNTSHKFFFAAALSAFLFSTGLATAKESPTPAKAGSAAASPAVEWSQPSAGVQAGFALRQPVQVNGAISFGLSLRNTGSGAVALGPAKEAFAWVLVAQGKENVYYTEKLPLQAAQEWPAALAGGTELELKALDLQGVKAYRYVKGTKLAGGYPAAEAAAPAGKVGALLTPGRATAKWIVLLPRQGEPPLSLISAALPLEVSAGNLDALSPAQRAKWIADLLQRFDRDAFGGQAAHAQAVKIGKPLLRELIAAVKEADRPSHSRMWLATTIADIPDDSAAAALADLLNDSDGAVRCVVAYHGPKQKNDKLDKAIIAAARESKDDRFAAYALLSFLVHRGKVPDELVHVGLNSPDPRARATAAKALATMASQDTLARLRDLAKDQDPRVRDSAQKILDAMQKAAP